MQDSDFLTVFVTVERANSIHDIRIALANQAGNRDEDEGCSLDITYKPIITPNQF
jgi:hypothetical protein